MCLIFVPLDLNKTCVTEQIIKPININALYLDPTGTNYLDLLSRQN